MYSIPTSVQIGEQSYPIRNNGDYRMVLDCFIALNDMELSQQERLYACLIIFYDGMEDISDWDVFSGNLEEAVMQMFKFFNCGSDIEKETKSVRLIDWENDSQLICSAINNVAGTEIRALPYLHWWTFMGYYLAIGESPLSTVVGIRNKIATNQKLEKHERQFQHDNPQYFKMDYRTDADREYDELVKQVWNKGD